MLCWHVRLESDRQIVYDVNKAYEGRTPMSIRRLCCLVLTLWLLAGSAFAAAPALQEEIYAPEALLYCVESGQTLYEKEADKPVPPASVTKLMTALVVLEHEADLSQTTTVSDTAVDIERDSTNVALVPGEEVTLEDMLYATLMQSANDAANVLAEYVGGTQAGFAQMMNDRAAALGCTGSHFENAHGLDAPGHVMTARDVARILAALVDDPRFLEIAGALVYTMPATNMQPEARTFYTKQRMLRQNSKFYNEYAIAGKNGYTTGAQHTQCMAARRDGLTFIAVSMGSSGNMYYPWRDMRTLFAYALDDLHLVTIGAGQLRQMADAAGIAGADPQEEVTLALPLDADAGALSLAGVPDEAGAYPVSLAAEGGTEAVAALSAAALGLAVRETAAEDTASAPQDTGPAASPAPSVASAPAFGWLKWLLIPLGLLALFVLWFVLTCVYRARKARRSRERIARLRRASQERDRRERQG